MKSRQQGKLLYKIIGVVIGLAVVAYGIQERSEITSIQAHGKHEADDPITEYKEFKQSGSSTYTAEFHYKIDDGRQFSIKHSFPEEVLEEIKAGKPVEIVYMPNDPSAFVFASEKASWTFVTIGVVIAVLALLLG
jgi:hypothetical protein